MAPAAGLVVYGIPNCDTVKRGRAWLQERNVEFRFHDFKKQGVPPDRLDAWSSALGWEALLNRKGTTWRQADDATRDRVVDSVTARDFLLAHPSAIRRPVVEWPDLSISAGFDAADWAARR